ncbi:hypothetical protein B0H16DRAFT_1534349 [Mycena metata]|uniref:Uncharacterized protein n=1 Tax=Mycena metata TaxID=1033252 RepID=A0AAD7JBT9_9AGAR|nr:hypothetical protein B0H16DRAFT_1534349 [Mycena metata]
MLVVIGLLLVVALLYYTSPTRLTGVLSDAMSNLDKVFGEVSTAGLLGLLTPEDVQTVVSTYIAYFTPSANVTFWQASNVASRGRKGPNRDAAQFQIVVHRSIQCFTRHLQVPFHHK